MKKTYSKAGVKTTTPQSQPIPGREKRMAQNNAGGYSFDAGKWVKLERFLILGTEGGTYYLSEHKYTEGNYDNLLACLAEDYKRAIDLIDSVSYEGRAMRQDPGVLSLAVATTTGRQEVTRYALSKLPRVCRTASTLFMFSEFLDKRRSWGRAVKRAVSKWYLNMPFSKMTFQMAKYQERNGWSHKDVLRSCHPKAMFNKAIEQNVNAAFAWAVGKEYNAELLSGTMIEALEKMKKATTATEVIDLIEKYNAPWEIVPTQFRDDKRVWIAMLPTMGTTALIRNLANMTRYGVFESSDKIELATKRLESDEILQKARVHPLQVLIGMMTYNSGKSLRGNSTWSPNRHISHAFENAFYKSFKYAPSTGKKLGLFLDVSASMQWGNINGLPISPAQVSGCLAMAVLEKEPGSRVLGFDTGITDLVNGRRPIFQAGAKLETIVRALGINGGGTDCSLPMTWALTNRVDLDGFVVLTDNETWAGNIHPAVAMQNYRNKMNKPDAKLIVVGMTATEFSIADPQDPGMLDVVGCSSDLPALINNFVAGTSKPVEESED